MKFTYDILPAVPYYSVRQMRCGADNGTALIVLLQVEHGIILSVNAGGFDWSDVSTDLTKRELLVLQDTLVCWTAIGPPTCACFIYVYLPTTRSIWSVEARRDGGVWKQGDVVEEPLSEGI